MEAIQTTKSDLKADFNEQMAKLKYDVMASQECSSQEVVKKLNKRVYQFRRKGNEAQYAFNSSYGLSDKAAVQLISYLTQHNSNLKVEYHPYHILNGKSADDLPLLYDTKCNMSGVITTTQQFPFWAMLKGY